MKILNAFLVGYLLLLALIFTLFVGLWMHYFVALGIDEYFNAIFFYEINFLLLIPVAFVLGMGLFYGATRKILRAVYLLCLIACVGSWFESVGRDVGERLYAGQSYERSTRLSGRLMYESAKFEYFLPENAERVIKFRK